MKAIFRQYPDGEGVVIMPSESGDPEGNWAAAMSLTTGFFAVDPEMVFGNTKPAKMMTEKRLIKALKDVYGLEVEKIGAVPAGAAEARRKEPEGYTKFATLKNQLL